MNDIRTRPATKEYLEGWDRIFAPKVNWVVGKTILQIRAIQECARVTGKFCDEIVKDESLWKPYLYKTN